MNTIAELEKKLSEPSPRLIEDIRSISGDIIILGAGGKMGPTLAKMARRAADKAGLSKRIIAVSRFSSHPARIELEQEGVETIAADLLDPHQLNQLPEAENVIHMAGFKFGTVGNEAYTWAMNTYLPACVAQKFKGANIVNFSSGNVYPLTPVSKGGATETHPTGPIGEYAQSCLGRERIFEYFAHLHQIKIVHFRLNYAIDLRYGVLLDVARQVKERKPIDLNMGHVNVVWQGDANEMAIRSLRLADSPPLIINVTGPETISIRWLARQFGNLLQKEPVFLNEEKETALLSNASKAHQLLGYPNVPLQQMIEWVARWVEKDGIMINKPTHFQQREGAF
ncbi:NAD(P)-dependent oxidoreductase [Fictibacillus sp. WQ 8-8]|uniref:NAD-dependent epimerase/dehydratase family protein n=1 Tax=unclassified Fictibacillus TaxID=2644029 RepID=UPI00210B03D5|nr:MULTISPECIES: NAD(P)-dependent oxidoreductase [unclassified Fictibacillus]MCQ6267944.1 NAD(P)-dependent oxidoreductase [Fictibacillus sp. WQ 8-8]MED2974393.1 NAD(P)-dependent oxidoreductase [Fictibacillus sp. B-59209]